jgi:hypothetical protein
MAFKAETIEGSFMFATLVAVAAFSTTSAKQAKLPNAGADERCESVYSQYRQLLAEPETIVGKSHVLRITIEQNHCNGAGVIDVWLDNGSDERTWTVRKQLLDRTGALQIAYASQNECTGLANVMGQLATFDIKLSLTSIRDGGRTPLPPGLSGSYTFLFDLLMDDEGSLFDAQIRTTNGPLVDWVRDELLGNETCWSHASHN